MTMNMDVVEQIRDFDSTLEHRAAKPTDDVDGHFQNFVALDNSRRKRPLVNSCWASRT
jgi:hypothetical protein